MTDSGGKGDARSLVSSVLSRVSGGDAGARAADGDPPGPATDSPRSGGASPGAAPSSPDAPHADPGPPVLPGGEGPPQRGIPADAAALAGSILAKLGGASDAAGGAAADAAPPAQGPSEEDLDALIEVYFELEEPEERDALFDQLIAIHSPVVDEFLRAMMEEDEDDYVRAAAAAEMARRGDRDALARLEADLEDPEEDFFFEHAVQVLGQIHGVGFYERLSQIWKDDLRDGDQRREVMLGMEALDLERALADFRRLVDDSVDIGTMPDDQIEVALMAFLRHAYTDALPSLDGLIDRIRAADIDPDEKIELLDFVREGRDQLAAQG